MAAPSYEYENLRRLAVRFVNEIEKPFGFTSEAGQVFIWSEADSEEFNRFLTTVQTAVQAVKIHVVVQSYTGGHMLKSELYKRVCLQLIGHADLFNRFEQLMFLNDGREETRREIEVLRVQVKDYFLQEIGKVLRDIRFVIGKLGVIPVILTCCEIEFVMKTSFSGADVETKFDIVLNLVTNPGRVSDEVVHCLENKQRAFQQMRGYVSAYFARLSVNPI